MKSFSVTTTIRNLPLRLLWIGLEQEEKRYHELHETRYPYKSDCAICIQKEEEKGTQWENQQGENV